MVLGLKSMSVNIQQDKCTQNIANKIRTLFSCHSFQFRVKEHADEDDDPDQMDIKIPYMNGAQTEAILKNFENIFSQKDDSTIRMNEVEILIWKFLRVILLCFICAPSKLLLQDKEFSIATYRLTLTAFSRLIRIRYSTSLSSHITFIS
jgi:hypothetical protein